jgi:hypothetical protein
MINTTILSITKIAVSFIFKRKLISIQKKIEYFFFIPIQLKRVERGFLFIADEPELLDMMSVVVTK